MATSKANSTSAPEARDTGTDEPVTKLANVPDPAKISAKQIKEIAGDTSDKGDPEQSANRDVKETLEQNRADAKAQAKGDEPERGYFHGQGGATGV